MAEPVLLSDCKVYLGPVDLSTTVRSINLSAATAEQPNGRMGDTVDGIYPGLVQLNCSVGGFFGAGAGDSDPTIWGRFNGYAAGTPLTFCPPQAPAITAGAAGNTCYVACGPQLSYETWGNHGDLLPYTFKTAPETTKRGLYRQSINIAKQTSTGAIVGSGVQLGVLDASHQIVVTYHVFSVTGGTNCSLGLYSDDNSGFTSESLRLSVGTFVPAVSTYSGQATLSGPIATDDYWRLKTANVGGPTYVIFASFSVEPL